MKRSLALILTLFLFGTSSIEAQIIDSIKIIPDMPMPSDEVKVIAYTFHTSSDCWVVDSSIDISNNEITVNVVMAHGLLAALCNSVDTFSLGMLEAGEYMLWLNTEYEIPTLTYTYSINFTVGLIDGIPEPETSDLIVYPNPVNGIQLVNIDYEAYGKIHMDIYSISGEFLQVVYQGEVAPGQNEIPIDLQRLPPGTYLLEIRMEEETRRIKVITF